MRNLGILVFVIGMLLLVSSAVFNQMDNEQTNEANSFRTAEGTNHKWSAPALIGIITIFAGVGVYLIDARKKQLNRKKT